MGASHRPKRLLIVLSSFCAEGTPVLTLELCQRWTAMGIEPTVIALRSFPADLAPEFRAAGIATRTLEIRGRGWSRLGRLSGLAYKLCRTYRADAMLSMPFGWHAFLALGARMAGVRAVAAHVGNYPAWQTGASFAKARLLVQAGRFVTSRLFCCSSYVQSGVVAHLGVPIQETEVIYNGVDVEAISKRAVSARERRGRRGVFRVGMVARFECHKDQPTLIRAARILQDFGRSVEVWLIGDGSRRLEYDQLIEELEVSDVVKVLGVRRDIPELLGQLDAFVFAATADEGLGVALVEAIAAGVPVIASDVGACREVLEGDELGILVPPADPPALAAAIDTLAREPRSAAARVERARCRAMTVFSIHTMAASYARSLNLLAGSG